MVESAFSRCARRLLVWLTVGLIAAPIVAPALGVAPRRAGAVTPADAPAQPTKQAHSGVVGVWEGTTLAICPGSLANRCNAEQKVTITLVEGEGSKLTGFYKCAYGNMNCYNMNETGKIIEASLSGRLLRLRVLMPDGTSCMFNGRIVEDSVNGGYSCYAGGSLLERGSWRAKRAY
jgi:hypothetical protein